MLRHLHSFRFRDFKVPSLRKKKHLGTVWKLFQRWWGADYPVFMGWKWLHTPSTVLNHPEPCKASADIELTNWDFPPPALSFLGFNWLCKRPVISRICSNGLCLYTEEERRALPFKTCSCRLMLAQVRCQSKGQTAVSILRPRYPVCLHANSRHRGM